MADFLTGQRKEKDATEWLVTERPELRIIDDEVFEQAQKILHSRNQAFNLNHERQSNKYLFSTLIKCKECGWSFRRTVRKYKNTYVRWVCSGHNGKGADSCPNAVTLDEEELIEVLQEYFSNVLKNKKKVIQYVVKEFQRVYKAKDENVEYEKELKDKLAKLKAMREKYMDMYTDDLITRQELNDRIGGARQEIERLENELKMVTYQITKGDQLEELLNRTFQSIEDITDVHQMTNTQLKKIIEKIEVDKDGNVDIYLKLLGDLGLDEAILVADRTRQCRTQKTLKLITTAHKAVTDRLLQINPTLAREARKGAGHASVRAAYPGRDGNASRNISISMGKGTWSSGTERCAGLIFCIFLCLDYKSDRISFRKLLFSYRISHKKL